MIVVDIEMSGTDILKDGIWQIGAIDTDDSEKYFLDECRIDDDEETNDEAMLVCGVTEEYLRNKNKQSQKELLEKFFRWCESSKIKNFICQGPQVDAAFLRAKASKHSVRYPFHWRAYDLHSMASLKYKDIYGHIPTSGDHSDMGLHNILFFCGMSDNRKEHNALEDAKLTAECFMRIVYGKKFLKEFEDYGLPEYLQQIGDE